MEDEKIIGLFFAREQSAITELDRKYGGACHKLAYNILNDRLDAEECVNDAYLGTWNAIPPQHPHPLLTFVCRIVRNLSIKRYRANTALKRGSQYEVALSEVTEALCPAGDTVAETLDARELARLLETFLDGLSAENRVIFLRRYWFADSYADIAARVGLTEKNVSVRLARVRRQLKVFLQAEGVAV